MCGIIILVSVPFQVRKSVKNAGLGPLVSNIGINVDGKERPVYSVRRLHTLFYGKCVMFLLSMHYKSDEFFVSKKRSSIFNSDFAY